MKKYFILVYTIHKLSVCQCILQKKIYFSGKVKIPSQKTDELCKLKILINVSL